MSGLFIGGPPLSGWRNSYFSKSCFFLGIVLVESPGDAGIVYARLLPRLSAFLKRLRVTEECPFVFDEQTRAPFRQPLPSSQQVLDGKCQEVRARLKIH